MFGLVLAWFATSNLIFVYFESKFCLRLLPNTNAAY